MIHKSKRGKRRARSRPFRRAARALLCFAVVNLFLHSLFGV